MAYPSVSAPYGLIPINLIGGQVFAGATRQRRIASAYNTAIFYGDAVKLTTTGTIVLANETTTAPATGFAGVFLGCSYVNAQGQVILPSAVRYLENGGRQIGSDALLAQAEDPQNTLVSVKRFMGRGLKDIANADKLPYQFVDKPGMLAIQTRAGEKSPVEVSAEILATLRFRAEDTFNDDLYGAVITVPAYFDDAQRQATKDAAQLAGLNVLRLINEPTAAAIAYGLDQSSEGVYAVYDLGGGTFDISILRLTRGVFEVLATGGDSALGGDDYDRALVEFVQSTTSCVVATPSDKAQVMVVARACKEALSTQDSVQFEVTLSSGAVACAVTRAQFEEACKPLTQRTLNAVRKALRDAGLQKQDIQGVVMVGGSTRMPHIQTAVADLLGNLVMCL